MLVMRPSWLLLAAAPWAPRWTHPPSGCWWCTAALCWSWVPQERTPSRSHLPCPGKRCASCWLADQPEDDIFHYYVQTDNTSTGYTRCLMNVNRRVRVNTEAPEGTMSSMQDDAHPDTSQHHNTISLHKHHPPPTCGSSSFLRSTTLE